RLAVERRGGSRSVGVGVGRGGVVVVMVLVSLGMAASLGGIWGAAGGGARGSGAQGSGLGAQGVRKTRPYLAPSVPARTNISATIPHHTPCSPHPIGTTSSRTAQAASADVTICAARKRKSSAPM